MGGGKEACPPAGRVSPPKYILTSHNPVNSKPAATHALSYFIISIIPAPLSESDNITTPNIISLFRTRCEMKCLAARKPPRGRVDLLPHRRGVQRRGANPHSIRRSTTSASSFGYHIWRIRPLFAIIIASFPCFRHHARCCQLKNFESLNQKWDTDTVRTRG